MKHQLVAHQDCTILHCPICDGGLAVCEICEGMEGSLTTECPGVKMTIEQQDSVYNKHIDFYDRGWHHV